MVFAYVAITLYGSSFQRASANHRIGNSTVADPTTPAAPNTQSSQPDWLIRESRSLPLRGSARSYDLIACKVQQVWAMSDFARHYSRNRGCFLFLQVLRWFTSLGSLAPAYGFSGPYAGFTSVGFPIRKSPGQSLLAALRGLSQLATSFIAIFRQGIHHAPLVA